MTANVRFCQLHNWHSCHQSQRGPLKCGACHVKWRYWAKARVLLVRYISIPVCSRCYVSGVQGVCMWCCKPGKNLRCPAGDKQFCKTCLKNNLGPSYIKLAEHGAWTFLCWTPGPWTGSAANSGFPGSRRRDPSSLPGMMQSNKDDLTIADTVQASLLRA